MSGDIDAADRDNLEQDIGELSNVRSRSKFGRRPRNA